MKSSKSWPINWDINLSEIPDILLSWDDKMNEKRLVTFGSHTLTHPMLLKMPAAVATREVAKSKADIEGWLGEKITSFCYPDGYFSEKIKDIVREAGYRTAVSTVNGLNTDETDPYELRRIGGRQSILVRFCLECGRDSGKNAKVREETTNAREVNRRSYAGKTDQNSPGGDHPKS